MRKMIGLSVAAVLAASVASASTVEDLKAELEALKKEVAALKKQTKGLKVKRIKKQMSELKAAALHDNIKWSIDFRSSYDAISYKHASGLKRDKSDLISNRMWLGMKYAPLSNLSFFGQLSYNKMFGQSQSAQPGSIHNPGFNYFDWVVGDNATDGTLKVRQAYFVYFGDSVLGANVPWTASIGRRPSTNGFLVNYRDDDKAASPIGHNINVEFDGASFGFDISNITNVSGMYFKICMGRGFTNAVPRFASQTGDDYISEKEYTADNDMAGFIFKPYDDGQYKVITNYFYSWNLLGFSPEQLMPDNTNWDFQSVGGMHGWAISAIAEGVGDGINDFLDDTVLFVSYAGNKTDPKSDQFMLTMPNMMTGDMSEMGKSHTGWSIYAGAQFPAMITDEGRIGLEYNHGSKYWRSLTYGEDTLIGSKLAARGDAYEVYFTQPLLGKVLSMQLRYTYIDYKYTGSNSFFGADGVAMDIDDAYASGMMDPVDKAQDFRAYIRYRY